MLNKDKTNESRSKEQKPARAAKSREKCHAESCNIGDISEVKCRVPRLSSDGKRHISSSFVCLSDFCCPLSVRVSLTLYTASTDREEKPQIRPSRAQSRVPIKGKKKKQTRLFISAFVLF